jgi:hypothetical protein
MRTGCHVAGLLRAAATYLLSEPRFNVAMKYALVRCLLGVLIMISLIVQRGISCPEVYGTGPTLI